MKSVEIFKCIFNLAVRFLELVFLCFGLSAVQPLLDSGELDLAGRSDIITTVLSIIFTLAVDGGSVDTTDRRLAPLVEEPKANRATSGPT